MVQEVLLTKGDLTLDLGALLAGSEEGAQVLAGLTGQGLAPVLNQWFEGTGPGATLQGTRVLPRDLDLPLLIEGPDPAGVQSVLSRLVTIFKAETGSARLWLVRGSERRFTDVARTAGGDWTSGEDSDGETWVRTLVTVRAGDPYWTREEPAGFEVRIDDGGRGLLPLLGHLQLTSSLATGERVMENPGDANALPVWTVHGPGRNFTAVSPAGERLRWEGWVPAGETLTLSTITGTVVDGAGENRYDLLASAPRFWTVPPGISAAKVTLDDATTQSRITCTWQPRWEVSF
jgi:hypothetical protein